MRVHSRIGAVLLVLVSAAVEAQQQGAFPGQTAPRFALKDLSARTVTLDDVEAGASAVVLLFWGSY